MKTLSLIVDEISPAMSVKFNMAVYDLQKAGKDITVLSLGEAFFDIPMFSFDKLPFQKGYHYSSSLGLLELRRKISDYYISNYSVVSDPDKEVLISAGSKIIIYMILLSILNPGDEVIILEPAWVSYSEQIKLAYGVSVMVPYFEDVKNLGKYITEKTRAIIVNNPNNPSGKVYLREELRAIYQLAQDHGLYILSDEAYSDFVTKNEPFISMGVLDIKKERVFVINSLSKCLGISGWRIGYVIANSNLIAGLLKVNQHLITCPTTLIEYYLIAYFDNITDIVRPQLRKVVEQRQEIAKKMDEIGLRYLPGTGTFYFLVSIDGSGLSSEQFALDLLYKHGISTVPGVGYGQSVGKFLRVSVGTESMERITKALETIHKYIEETHE